MSDEGFKKILDLIETVHDENIWILKLLLKITHVDEHIADTFISELEDKFRDKRSRW